LLDGHHFTVLLAILFSPELAAGVSGQKNASAALERRLGRGRRAEDGQEWEDEQN
jgi:hypothetical protein